MVFALSGSAITAAMVPCSAVFRDSESSTFALFREIIYGVDTLTRT